jgi:hypothetical protein
MLENQKENPVVHENEYTMGPNFFYESPFRYAHIINNILRLNECCKIWSYDCEKVNLLLPVF